MPHSLNPKAADAHASDTAKTPEGTVAPATTPSQATPPVPPIGSQPTIEDPSRRHVLASGMAIALGTVAAVAPVAVGASMVLDPILRKKDDAGPPPKPGEKAAHPSIRVATLDSLPADGRPIAVPVIADKVDAWTREPNQPVGAVFLRRLDKDKVECFNAICPHAGCMVAFSGDRNCFQCPCHTSSFNLDGTRMMPSPSPRDMDHLVVDETKLKEGEVWVEFVNYYPGKANQEAKG